jgi:hypothetical protein
MSITAPIKILAFIFISIELNLSLSSLIPFEVGAAPADRWTLGSESRVSRPGPSPER